MPRGKGNVDDAALLAAALEGLELQKARIEEQIRTVKARLGRGSAGAKSAKAVAGGDAPPRKKRRPLSEAARKRIAAAQKKRWANFRKTQPNAD